MLLTKGAHGAGHRATLSRAFNGTTLQLVAVLFDLYCRQHELLERAQRALDGDFGIGQDHFDALRYFDRIFCDT
jgi:hypothetical protein